MHKRRAALLVFLIQPLRLFQLLVYQHFSVLITNDEDLSTRSDLAAELTNFVQFIINGGLNHPLMLVSHGGDVLQIKMWQQVIGNLVAHNRAIGLLVMHQKPQR
ncbi:hypothetical protein D3C78_957730 [compost metagenome]